MSPDVDVAERARLPVVRVRHPCPNAAEFRARFAGALAKRGIFVPMTRARPVGARVELVVELRDGAAVRGEALAVDAATRAASGRGLTFRFVRLYEGSLPLEDPAAEERAPVTAPAAPSSEELFTADEQEDLLAGEAVVEEAPAGADAEATIDVPLRRDVLETRTSADEAERFHALRRRRARLRLAAAGAAAAGAVALAVYLVTAGQARREIDAHVATADERLADGRVAGGGDSALDHLVAARSLRPDDPQVRERLRLVADKLEELAERALARGDYAEAAVHLTAASQAEPDRKRIHVRLGEIARNRGRASRELREPARTADEEAPPSPGSRTAASPE